MTYQMLLVDDEVHAIEGVKADLDLAKLSIVKFFTAYSMRQAKDVFEQEVIDILLCDIEMPQGSGLELAAWVREHHPETVTIFLTSHADFKYAKEALKLGSLDYLLKPVLVADLENAIENAQNVLDKYSENNRHVVSHQLWMKHHAYIIERFWLDLINHSTPSTISAVREQVERHNVPITDDSIFLPILISIQRWNKDLKRRDEKILEYALKNTAQEIIIGSHLNGICFQLDPEMLLVILVQSKNVEWDNTLIKDTCDRYIESCNKYFYCDLSCYLGYPVEAHEMAVMVANLRNRDRNNVATVNQLFTDIDEQVGLSVTLPKLSSVASLMKSGTKDVVLIEVEKLLNDLVRKQEMSADVLHQFHQDFMQVLYSYLNVRGVQAYQLLGDELSRKLSEAAGRSVTDMLNWVRHVVDKAMRQADVVREAETVIETVKRYIALNLDQDLPREQVAEQVFLNPDYLSRMFKKETGYSISDYILIERINHAKSLLSQTNVPISSIATAVGYTNFSHFAKIFKKMAGVGPTEFRLQHGNEK
ncbi:response regulator transcription factor [Paenibacillus sinopodophylli]|uniref:response regulator transcription factor n=1 Tax=Paenibacillus sinopodophylli TaxID=1837342 RepID=UPI00110CBF60|nr:helix-turn-helix domain-containing protein [Paenibacillus sinopodophylli]